jgi:hypothetical protein
MCQLLIMKYKTLILCLTLSLAVILVGCAGGNSSRSKKESEPKQPSAVLVDTDLESSGDWLQDQHIYTIKHDGHKFVYVYEYDSNSLLHHPSCECLTSR